MTDQEHAKKINELTSRLNGAIYEASQDGLEVNVELLSHADVGGPEAAPFVVARTYRLVYPGKS